MTPTFLAPHIHTHVTRNPCRLVTCLWLTTSMGTVTSCVDRLAHAPAAKFETPATVVSDKSSCLPALECVQCAEIE